MSSLPSWPGLSRPSTSCLPHMPEGVDARDEPGHDDVESGSACLFPHQRFTYARLRRALRRTSDGDRSCSPPVRTTCRPRPGRWR
ncbi:hypothetical protein FLL57_14325 [Rhodopseudomonas palustris]|nr:hypothetical protein FLL57_14325 [Rhodopseudomonas palustris]